MSILMSGRSIEEDKNAPDDGQVDLIFAMKQVDNGSLAKSNQMTAVSLTQTLEAIKRQKWNGQMD